MCWSAVYSKIITEELKKREEIIVAFMDLEKGYERRHCT